jgi:hypothetical protein
VNTSIATAFAIEEIADQMCGGRAPNKIVVMCCCCYNEADPNWEWSVHRAPASAECMRCTDDVRWAEGMLFVVVPKGVIP